MIPLPALILGSSASVLAVATVSIRTGRVPALPAIVSCPHCHQTFGGESLRHAATITYQWTPAQGSNVEQLNLPRSIFLAACPHCAAESEFTPDGTLFQPPKTGILSYLRTGKLSITPPVRKAAA